MSITRVFCEFLLRTAIIPSLNPSVTVQIRYGRTTKNPGFGKGQKILKKIMLGIVVVL